MAIETKYARISNAFETDEKYLDINITPLKGEILGVSTKDGYYKIKIGDGKKKYKDLDFVDQQAIDLFDKKSLKFLGINPLKNLLNSTVPDTEHDTVDNWITIGTGYAYIGGEKGDAYYIKEYPYDYASFLINLVYGKVVYQMLFPLTIKGTICHRAGSPEKGGWYAKENMWVKELNSKDDLILSITDEDISEETINSLQYVTRQLNKRIEDKKRVEIENALTKLDEDFDSVVAERRRNVCIEALKHATDVDMCPYKYPLSIYGRAMDLYAELDNPGLTYSNITRHRDKNNPYKLSPMTDEVVCRLPSRDTSWYPSGKGDAISFMREIIRYNPNVTGADCAGGISGVLYKCNLLVKTGGINSNGFNHIKKNDDGTYENDPDNTYTTILNNKSELQPGDTVGYNGHVGLYVGAGYVVEWINPYSGCLLTSLDDKRKIFNFQTQEFSSAKSNWKYFCRPKFYESPLILELDAIPE